jgi:peptidyl-prolyl cis-trans isomerase SurA
MLVLALSACQSRPDPGAQVVARVADGSVTRQQLDQGLGLVQRPASVPLDNPLLQRRALESLIQERALALAAEKSGAKPTKQTVDAELARKKQQFPTEESWAAFLARSHRSEAELREEIESRLVREKILAKAKAAVSVSDAEVAQYYAEHRATFVKSNASIRGRLAQVRLDARAAAAERRTKRDKLEKLRAVWQHEDCKKQCVCDGGEPDDPGDPDVDRTPFCREWDKLAEPWLSGAVGRLNEGDVSPVLETPEGYAVFQLGERRAEHVISLEQAREDIRYKLLQDKRVATERAALQQIVCDAKPEVFIKPGGQEMDLGCPKDAASPAKP